MSARILVTSLDPGRLVALLEASGAVAVALPLVAVEATGTAMPAGSFDAVLYSAATALRFSPPLDLPRACVGAATAAAAGGARWVGETGLGALVAQVRAELGEAARLLHVGARELGDEAAAAGLVRWAVYETLPRPLSPADWLAAGPVDVVTLASPSAARVFAAGWPGPRPKVVVIGPTTAAAAEGAGLVVAAVAARPTAAALAAAALAQVA